MTPNRYKQINELLDAVLKLEPNQRQAFLDQACAGDEALRREIAGMLTAEEKAAADGFLELPAPARFAEVLATDLITRGTLNKPVILNGRYLVEEKIGHGGFAEIYLARDLRIHSRPIVIKVLFEQSSSDEWLKKKFQQEIESLARIDHPGVVGILDVGDTPDGKPFLVMQYVKGHDIRYMLRSERINLEQAAAIIRQVAHALSAAHEQGVFHCDLKPENIMLQNLGEGEYQVKIVDFGIAKIKDSQVRTGSQSTRVAGTVSYMAPELIQGKPSAASDIFSLAVIAYEMLTGRLPFNPPSPYQAVEAVRAGVSIKPCDLRTDISTTAEQIILKALSFDPSDRYKRARDFGELLAQSLTSEVDIPVLLPTAEGGDHSTDEVVTPNLSGNKKPHQSPWWLAVMALLALAMIVGISSFGAWRSGLLEKLSARFGGEYQQPPPAKIEATEVMQYRVLLEKPNGFLETLEANNTVGSGEAIRFGLRAREEGAIYLLAEEAGSWYWLYPAQGGTAPLLKSNQDMFAPQGYWIEMDDRPGLEQYWIVHVPLGADWSLARFGQTEFTVVDGRAYLRPEAVARLTVSLADEGAILEASSGQIGNSIWHTLIHGNEERRVTYSKIVLNHVAKVVRRGQ